MTTADLISILALNCLLGISARWISNIIGVFGFMAIWIWSLILFVIFALAINVGAGEILEMIILGITTFSLAWLLSNYKIERT